MRIILYTIDCPKCKILEQKLNKKSVNYEIITDQQLMLDKGFKTSPMLEVDGETLDFINAVNFVNKLN